MISSKERILGSIRHQPIDRVAVSTYNLVGWNEASWENRESSYKKLMDAIREHTDCIYMLNPQKRETPDPLIETFEWREEKSRYTRKIYHSKDGDLSSLYRQDDNIHTTWTLKHPLDEIDDIDKYLSIQFETPKAEMKAFFDEQTKLGDQGVMMISIDDPICQAAELFEMGTFLIHAINESKKIKYFLDAIHERQMEYLRSILKHDCKDVIFRICGPEYATPPYLSPEYFAEYVTCYLIRICREIKEAGGIPRIHCHGKIRKVLGELAKTEADAIDPVEPPPDGDITLAEVKKLYGNKFCLFGNIELRELEVSTNERIDMLVKDAMNDAKSGSGFILLPTAAPITAPLPKIMEQNYLQMIESALKYGQY